MEKFMIKFCRTIALLLDSFRRTWLWVVKAVGSGTEICRGDKQGCGVGIETIQKGNPISPSSIIGCLFVNWIVEWVIRSEKKGLCRWKMPIVQKYKWSKIEGETEYDATVNKSKENNIKSESKRRRLEHEKSKKAYPECILVWELLTLLFEG